MSEKDTEVEMFVAGLALDPATNSPIVVLQHAEDDRCLPIWIGEHEAAAIAAVIRSLDAPRPMTHDLFHSAIEALGGRLVRVSIRGLEGNIFFADLEVVVGEELRLLDARPSDAIALALRAACPIFVRESVLRTVSGDAQTDSVQQQSGSPAEFSEIGKDKWEELLAAMNPADFKYKM